MIRGAVSDWSCRKSFFASCRSIAPVRCVFPKYEDEQGVIQNKLESLWLKMDDYGGGAATRGQNLFRVAAALSTSVIDRVFGEHLSLRFILAAFWLYIVSADITLPWVFRNEGARAGGYLRLYGTLFFPLVFAFFPANVRRRWAVAIPLLGALAIIVVLSAALRRPLGEAEILFCAPAAISILLTIVLTIINRALFKWGQIHGTALQASAIALVNIALAITFVGRLLFWGKALPSTLANGLPGLGAC